MNTMSNTEMCIELVTANHILAALGIVDGFGHVSARVPGREDQFLLSRSKAPALVMAEDIMTLDFDGNPTEESEVPLYIERFIHSEIYRARPDVHGIVHSHASSILPFSVVPSVRLRPIFHMCGFLGVGTPCFEIRECVGEESDLLIRSPSLGCALAASLADGPLVLMRGHGMTAVGGSLRQAVFHAVFAETNARIQATAIGLGEITYLTPEEARAAEATNSGTVNRAWDLWVDRFARTPQDRSGTSRP